ncbi:MAG: hypothetical protein KDD44_03360 [Bdellovibrionales bacterium]|nr:hypothetical protein [Bdellovibrionales bacterium]
MTPRPSSAFEFAALRSALVALVAALLLGPAAVHAEPLFLKQPLLASPTGQRSLDESNAGQISSALQKSQLSAAPLQEAYIRLDSADSILMNSERRSNFLSYYRGLVYLKYVNDWSGIGNFDELESQSLAENVLMYHTAHTFTEFIEDSGLKNLYEDFLDQLDFYRELTTVTVEQRTDGDLGVIRGENDSAPLLKFSLGVSSKRGIEPKLNFGEHLTMRYDLLHGLAMLEYEIRF